MNLETSKYLLQEAKWPQEGRHILAQFDAESVIVYQAYRSAIGDFAATHGVFGGPFSYSRMSWIKPNFLWMMYRSGWGTKPGQEVILAVRLRRAFFEEVLAAAVSSSFDRQRFADKEEWQAAVQSSEVRLQWDPDHAPTGDKLPRRAVQLGLRGSMLERYGKSEVLEITDISNFVAEQRAFASPKSYEHLQTPTEEVFRPRSQTTVDQLDLATFE